MHVPILCLAAFMLLMWVVCLKCDIQTLQNENEKLKLALKKKPKHVAGEMEIPGPGGRPDSKSGIVVERS